MSDSVVLQALQSALAASGLLTDDVRARLEGIERALMAKVRTIRRFYDI